LFSPSQRTSSFLLSKSFRKTSTVDQCTASTSYLFSMLLLWACRSDICRVIESVEVRVLEFLFAFDAS
jgi:hypothetical protein